MPVASGYHAPRRRRESKIDGQIRTTDTPDERVHLTVRISPETKRELQVHAARRGVTVTALIDYLITHYLEGGDFSHWPENFQPPKDTDS